MKTEQYMLFWFTEKGIQHKTCCCFPEDILANAKTQSVKVNAKVEIWKAMGTVDYSKE
jgi:hypothetical protein